MLEDKLHPPNMQTDPTQLHSEDAAKQAAPTVAEEVRINETVYWPIRRVARVSRYNTDYIAYLCRTRQIAAVRLGSNWLVEESSARRLTELRDRREAARRSPTIVRRWVRQVIRRRERGR